MAMCEILTRLQHLPRTYKGGVTAAEKDSSLLMLLPFHPFRACVAGLGLFLQ